MRLSIRNTLLLLLICVLLLAIGLNSLFGHMVARHEVNEVFDAELVVSARLIKGLLNEKELGNDLPRIAEALQESLGSVQPAQPELEAYERTRLIQVWQQDGSELTFRSPGAPEYALAPMRKGFYHHEGKGGEWVVYVTDLPQANSWLMVGEYPYARAEIIDELGQVFGVSGVIALIICSLVALTAIDYGLGPLKQLGSVLRRRSLNNLQAVDLVRTPKELTPVVEGLNQMFTRLSAGLERERRFVADAAHELRTPLSVIKLQTQHLQELDCHDLKDELQQLEQSADRSGRVVEQLLLLARLDEEQSPPRASLDLTELCRRTLAELQGKADKQGCTLGLDSQPEQIVLSVNSTMIEVAVRNLIENAVRYAPGTAVDLALAADSQQVELSVRDHGQGVSDSELQRLSERFYRAGNSHHGGAGLGLSMVARIADVHGARLRLSNHPQGGLLVTLTFPLGN